MDYGYAARKTRGMTSCRHNSPCAYAPTHFWTNGLTSLSERRSPVFSAQEPILHGGAQLRKNIPCLHGSSGLEPGSSDYESGALPLDHTAALILDWGFFRSLDSDRYCVTMIFTRTEFSYNSDKVVGVDRDQKWLYYDCRFARTLLLRISEWLDPCCRSLYMIFKDGLSENMSQLFLVVTCFSDDDSC